MITLRNIFLHADSEQRDVIAWRGQEITRIEGISDAVFALAITLLAVSMDVPKSFDELLVSLRGFVPFAVCFMLFFGIWSEQNQYFRRYGLHDEMTIKLNAMLLFAVLFFVYPLKFLFTILFKSFSEINGNQMQQLLFIFGGGFIVIRLLLGIMYWHANQRRAHLKLTDRESFETITYMYRNYSVAAVGLLSIVIAAIPIRYFLSLSGLSYVLIGFVSKSVIRKRKSRADKLFVLPGTATADAENEPAGEQITV